MKKKLSYFLIALFTLFVVMPSVGAVAVNVYGLRSANGTTFEESAAQLSADPLKCTVKFYENDQFATEINYQTNSDYTKVNDYHITLTNVVTGNNVYYVGFDCGQGRALIGLHAGNNSLDSSSLVISNASTGTEYRYTITLPVVAQNVYPKRGSTDIIMTEIQYTSPGCECKKADGSKVSDQRIGVKVFDENGEEIDTDEANLGNLLIFEVPNERCCPYKEGSLYAGSNSACRKYLQRIGATKESCDANDLLQIDPTQDGRVFKVGDGITLRSAATADPLVFSLLINDEVYDNAIEGMVINAQWDYNTECDDPGTPATTPPEACTDPDGCPVPSTGSNYSLIGVGIALVLVTSIGFVVFRKNEN